MRAGRLRHKVLIEQAEKTEDSMGSVTESWSTFATTHMRMVPFSGAERVENMQQKQRTMQRGYIRYISGVTTDMRINDGGTYHRIESVLNVENRNRELELIFSDWP